MYLVPPGESIKELAIENNLDDESVARHLNLSNIEYAKLIEGKIPIDAEIAASLQNLFEVDMKFWLTLEENYQESKRRLMNTLL